MVSAEEGSGHHMVCQIQVHCYH